MKVIKTKHIRLQLDPDTKYRVKLSANFECRFCHKNFKKKKRMLTVDHIIPLSKGGTNDRQNLQALCLRCNKFKSNHFL